MGLLDKAKDLVSKNKDKIDKGVEKAEDLIQKKTDDEMDAKVETAGNAIQDQIRKLD